MSEENPQWAGQLGTKPMKAEVKKRTRAYISLDPCTGRRSVVMLSSRSEGGPYLFGPFKVNAAAEWVTGQLTAGAHFPSARFAEREYERFEFAFKQARALDFQSQVQ